MFGLWDLHSKTLFIFYFWLQTLHLESVYLSLIKVLDVSIYCSVPCTVTSSKGQRLKRPKGMVRCSDSCQGCQTFSDIIYLDGGVTDWWGQWPTPEKDCVSANSERGWLCKKNVSKSGVGGKEKRHRWRFLVILRDEKMNDNLIS